jgi:putative membrane protein
MSWHMATHIAAMNVAAPVAAVVMTQAGWGQAFARPQALWLATIAQMVFLWAAHSPVAHHGLQTSAMAATSVHALLFLTALTFWLAVAQAASHKWQAMLALLVSGKLACLLGVLFIFAPRPLFSGHGAHHDHGAVLADQQLAGLLMIAACPLSYVLTAIVLATQAIGGRDRMPSRPMAEARGGR